MKNAPLVLIGLLLITYGATSYSVNGEFDLSTPQKDLREIREYFLEKLPHTPMREYVNGTYALDESAWKQWRSTEEFPPYEIDIERGKKLFVEPFINGRNYASCFKTTPEEIRKHYPYHEPQSNQVRTLLLDLNACRVSNGEPLLSFSSGDLVSVAAYLSYEGRGHTIQTNLFTEGAIEWYTEGKRLFFMKRGRMNFSCADCHIYNAGGSLTGQILSPAIGHVSHFPAWRSGWQELGSLHRRYVDCMSQTGAKPFEPQSREFRALEFFESYLSNDLPINAPGYRK